MTDFHFFTPTEIVFGRSSEEQLPSLLKKHGASKVLIHYGGGSAERSGLLLKIRTMLDAAGISFVELGGMNKSLSFSFMRILSE